MRVLLASTLLALTAGAASAITLSDTQAFTATNGQDFDFIFNGAPASNGTGGTLELTFKGDYSYNFAHVEFADLSFAGVSGFARIGNGSVESNSITGLTLDTITSDTVFDDDNLFTATFNVSASLLDDILAGGTVQALLDNDSDVNLVGSDDFNSFSLTYAEAAATVPLPAALPLFATALAGLAGYRRFKRS